MITLSTLKDVHELDKSLDDDEYYRIKSVDTDRTELLLYNKEGLKDRLAVCMSDQVWLYFSALKMEGHYAM